VAAYVALCRELGAEFDDVPPELRGASGTRIVDDLRNMRAFFEWSATEDELLTIRNRHFADACRTPDLQLMPGVETVVRDLHARGIPIAIATSAVKRDVESILTRFGLREL